MKHRLEYAIVRTLVTIVRVMPNAIVRASGTLLGLAFYTLDVGVEPAEEFRAWLVARVEDVRRRKEEGRR